VNEIGDRGLMHQYTKKELHHLCDAYGVNYLSNWNKEKLATALAGRIAQCENMPRHQVTSLCTVTVQQVDDLTKIPVLTFHRI
jgi:hypothetical protein